MHKNYEDKLFDLCFMNYPKYCRMTKYLLDVNEANFYYFSLPDDYKFMYLDILNQKCKTNEKVEINFNCEKIIFWEDRKGYLEYKDVECKKKYLKLNSYFYHEVFPYLEEYVKLCINKEDKEIKLKIGKIKEIYFDLIKKIYLNLGKMLENVSISNIINKKIIEGTKEFRYKFKEGSSSAGRMNIGIFDLFN
ncbi:hypothetical protein GVAV_000084 [Gurleya vavrai]